MNIVTANFFGISLVYYAAVMVPADLVSIAITLLVLSLNFRRDLGVEYRSEDLEAPQSAVKDPALFHGSFPAPRPPCWTPTSSRGHLGCQSRW